MWCEFSLRFFEVPNAALVPEVTSDYDKRTVIFSFRFFFGWFGGIFVAFLAYSFLLPLGGGILKSAGYSYYGLAASFFMGVAMLISCLATQAAIPKLAKPPAAKIYTPKRVFKELYESLANHSFLMIFMCGIFIGVVLGMTTGLYLYFANFFWLLTTAQLALFPVANVGSAVLALVITPPLARAFDKRRACLMLFIFAILFAQFPVMARFFDVFPSNESAWFLPLLLTHNFIDVGAFIGTGILISSMASDVVEESATTTGRRSEGVFFAARTFSQKMVSGLGLLLTGVILDLIQFPVKADPKTLDAAVLDRLVLSYVPSYVVLLLIAAFFLSRYSISRAQHNANVQRLGKQDM